MPDRPEWYARLGSALTALQAMPSDRPVTPHELALSLNVGLRTAQLILKPMATLKFGRGKAAPRITVLSHLHSLAQTEDGQKANEEYEHMREVVQKLVEERKRTGPPVIVEIPSRIQVERSRFETLTGVEVYTGRIIIDAAGVEDALRKLVALAMAIQNDMAEFERLISPPVSGEQLSFGRASLPELWETERHA